MTEFVGEDEGGREEITKCLKEAWQNQAQCCPHHLVGFLTESPSRRWAVQPVPFAHEAGTPLIVFGAHVHTK